MALVVWLVIVAGVIAIVGLGWFFFKPARPLERAWRAGYNMATGSRPGSGLGK